jgi:hypothetical protein
VLWSTLSVKATGVSLAVLAPAVSDLRLGVFFFKIPLLSRQPLYTYLRNCVPHRSALGWLPRAIRIYVSTYYNETMEETNR